MKNVIKYCRIEDNTLYIVTTKEGRKYIEGRGGLEEGTDEIAGTKVKAFIKKFPNTIKNFKHEETLSKNLGRIWLFTESGQFAIGYPCQVKEE